MESQGNSGRAGVTSRYGLAALRPRDGCRAKALSLFGAWCLFLSLFLWIGMALAQSTNYAYDANGRVVAVTQKDGTSVEYTYDALGHVSQISNPIPAGQLAIFSFMPTHGATGTQVTLTGQGFSATLANDTVSFNGVAATVLSASSTQLVVSVPAGATTGPISVTVGNQTAATTSSFVVDDGSVPPTITAVSPTIAGPGTTITVTGTHLDPVPGETSVEVGGYPEVLKSISDTQLQFSLTGAGSTNGYVVVQTPYGIAQSATPIILLPSNVSPSNIVSVGVATTNGQAVNLNIGAAGQMGVVEFNATSSSWLSLQASNMSTSGSTISYTVYAPGNVQIASGTITPTSPSIHLPRLTTSGTYMATFRPNTSGAQLSVSVQANATLAPLTPTTIVTTTSGQSQRVLFQGAIGQQLTFAINGTTTVPANQSVAYTVYRPDGTGYASTTTSSTGIINLPALPMAGTYQIIIAPGGSSTGTMQVELAPAYSGTLSSGVAQGFSTATSSQDVYLSFTATQGANLELTLNNITMAGASSNQFYVYVYNAENVQVGGFWCFPYTAGASCTQHLWYLPAGTYSAVVTPLYGGTISFNAIVQPDVLGPTLAAGATSNMALSAGQVERFTFNANAGDTVALNITGVTTTPSGQNMTVMVYRPDAGAITTSTAAYASATFTASQVMNLPNLPVSGTYTVIVAPIYGLPSSAQLSLLSGVVGALPTSGSAQSYAGNASGQNVYMSFTAVQGANLELTLNKASVSGATSNQFLVSVYNAAGTQVTAFWCYPGTPGASCTQHLWNLAAGNYSVVVAPSYGGTLSFNALLQPDIAGVAMTPGTTANLALNAGQVERLTFNANAGDTVALDVASVATTPTGQNVTILVYRPDAGVITTSTTAYASVTANGTQAINLPNLPVSGTYTVIVAPIYGLPSSVQLSMGAGVTGTLAANAASQSYAGNVAGQNVYLSFTATNGANLELTLNNISVVGATSNQFSVVVYNAAGTQVTGFWCYPAAAGASCTQHLWNMAPGTYTAVVIPNYGGTLSFNAFLQPDIVGPAIMSGNSANIALAAGAVERFTFNANAYDTVALNITGATETPTNGPGISILIYRPDTGAILANTPYGATTVTGSQTINLPNLPVTGAYTVIVAPVYGLPATAQLAVSDTAGTPPTSSTPTLPSNGTAQNESASAAGQNVTMTFNANQGDNLELTLSNIAVAGGSGVQVQVNSATGASIASANCYPTNPGGSCRVPLWSLSAGSYSVIVSPIGGGQESFTALLEPDVLGSTLTAGASATVNLAQGQVERLTFNANVGDTVALQLSNVATTPTGQTVYAYVYRPDVGQITTSNAYTSFSTTGSGLLNLPSLPVSGTYTVVVYTTYGEPSNAQLTWVPAVTGTLASNGSAQNYAANAAGQDVYMTFNANQGDNLELTLSNIVAAGGIEVHVNAANGNNLATLDCSPSNPGSSCRIPLWSMAAGTYSVVVYPLGYAQQSFTAQLAPDVAGPALTANTSTAVNLATGQVERFTFTANQGDTVALQLSGVSTTPAGQTMYAYVYRPDVGPITTSNAYTSFSTAGSLLINLASLPASGTYTVVVYTVYGEPGSATLTLMPGSTGALTSNGSAQNYTASAAYQDVYMSFNANQNDNLELTLSNIVVTGEAGVQVDVFTANGTDIQTLNCEPVYTGESCRLPLWNLAAGAYSVIVSPIGVGTATFTAQLQSDVIGPSLALNTPAAIQLGEGQVERLTFNGTFGSTVQLQLINVSTIPTGQTVYAYVYRPDTGLPSSSNYYASFSTSSSTFFNLAQLPVSGSYTVVLYTSYGEPANAQLTLVPQ